MSKHRHIVVGLLVLWAALTLPCHGQEVRVGFWNVENLFDAVDDTLSAGDDEWTPGGGQHWTYKRYERKLRDAYKVLAVMDFPAVMGLAEVENDRALRDLTLGTPLAQMGYRFIHFDSPDRRGIDCALIYRPAVFRPIDTSLIRFDFPTRDILCVTGVTAKGDTLSLFVCHLPSKLGGSEAEKRRLHCLLRLREKMDSTLFQYPTATLIAMGDFNSSPEELPEMGYSNLMAGMPKGEGTYCYQSVWNYIDQMLTNQPLLKAEVLRHDLLLECDRKGLTFRPKRTYLGPRYHGGISDHLPIYTVMP